MSAHESSHAGSERSGSERSGSERSGSHRAPDQGGSARSEPDSPTDLAGRSWLAVLRRSVREFRDDNVTDWAAALTYYGVLALFPGLLVLVSILGLLGRSTAGALLDNVGQIAPGSVRSFLRSVIDNAQQQRGAAGVLAVVGILLALWSASGYIGAFMRASNAIYEVREGRPVWKTAPVRLAVTVAVMLMLLASAAIVLLTGRVADQVGEALGIGSAAVTVWDYAKWPVLLVLVSLMLALLYWACPNVRQPGFRWITPGGLLAVLVWLVASGGFAVYVANFASYNKTYGSVAGVIVFLVWLWISNVAVLLGAEFDAELERQRAMAAGIPDGEQFAVPRDTTKLDDADTRRAEALARRREQP
jgi:membrane protein